MAAGGPAGLQIYIRNLDGAKSLVRGVPHSFELHDSWHPSVWTASGRFNAGHTGDGTELHSRIVLGERKSISFAETPQARGPKTGCYFFFGDHIRVSVRIRTFVALQQLRAFRRSCMRKDVHRHIPFLPICVVGSLPVVCRAQQKNLSITEKHK